MASPHPFEAKNASASIQKNGFYALEDDVTGNLLRKFHDARFPTKTPLGLDFIARSSFIRPDVRQVLESVMNQPHLGLIKVYSQELPRDYAFRLHNGSVEGTCCLLVQLWSQDAIVSFYEGSMPESSVVDLEVSRKCGLLATPKTRLRKRGILENMVHLKLGGLVLSDSRLQFSISQGYSLFIGFTTKDELDNWGTMELPYSDELKKKLEELKSHGVNMNYELQRAPSSN